MEELINKYNISAEKVENNKYESKIKQKTVKKEDFFKYYKEVRKNIDKTDYLESRGISKKLIDKGKYELKENGLMSKMGASMGIKKETKADNSDAAIAHMIIEGLTMGVVDISTKINNYKDVADKKVISLASDFLKFQEDEIERLKTFL